MKLRNTFITALFSIAFVGFCSQVEAQSIRTLKDYVNNCIPKEREQKVSAECDRIKEANQSSETEDASIESQSSQEKPGGISGYAGTTLGVFSPDIDETSAVFPGDDTDVNTGFGSSIYGGIRFNRYLATDLELSAFGGDIDSDIDEDENYTIFSLFLNPRFSLPLTRKKNSVSLYLSPGIGISQLVSGLEDEVEDFDRITIIEDDTRFTWQIKTGVSVPVSSKFSVIAQFRYVSQTGDNALDYIGTELGANFDF